MYSLSWSRFLILTLPQGKTWRNLKTKKSEQENLKPALVGKYAVERRMYLVFKGNHLKLSCEIWSHSEKSIYPKFKK